MKQSIPGKGAPRVGDAPAAESSLPRFDQIRPDRIEAELDEILNANRESVEQIAAEVNHAAWATFAEPLEHLEDRLERFWAPVSHLHAVRDSEALRSAYERCLPKLTQYHTELSQDTRLMKGFVSLQTASQSESMDTAQQKIVRDAVRDFRLSGVDLPLEQKTRFKAISRRLSECASRFENNVLDATDGWTLDIESEQALKGLPQSALDLAAQTARNADLNGWRFGLQFPSYAPFMAFAEHRDFRREMYEAFVTRASDRGPLANRYDNGPVLKEILKLRREMATLLGFSDYAAYSLETKMARSTEEVERFLLDLAERARPRAEEELKMVSAFAEKSDGLDTLEAWDLPYYSEKLKQSLYEFSEEDVRPFFPLPRVTEGLFKVVRRLFGIEVRRGSAPDLWHEDVSFYDIFDESGEKLGHFYFDLYARAHKRGGAWMADCVGRRRRPDGAIQRPSAFLTCNFAPPVGGRPSLLTHDEVITLFHEFGHGLHHLLTRVDYLSASGINGVPWDAVELPSQFLENWCWERASLDVISGHFESGDAIPADLYEKMQQSRNFQSAMQLLRQVEFALFDLRLHRDYDPSGAESVQALLDDVRREIAVVIPPDFNRFQHAFTHIFSGGYAAGYYSYKWAEVLSADAFSRFQEEGVFNRDVGEAFRDCILAQGGASEPMALFVAFRGREPKIDALLHQEGLLS